MADKKLAGQVFTPPYLVSIILNTAGYEGDKILRKHIIDNSAGAGAFLSEVVKRYCDTFLAHCGDLSLLKRELQAYIHGIEIDDLAFQKCIEVLNTVVEGYGLYSVEWDIKLQDALNSTEYYGIMDYVVGNPPYVRVHNLKDNYSAVKRFAFSSGGMTDIYLVFFELGLNMLKEDGILCYITPSSWLNSKAGLPLRNHIKLYRNLSCLIDLEHFQPFEATTYTIISKFQKGLKNETFSYFRFNEITLVPNLVEHLPYEKAFIGDDIFLGTCGSLDLISQVRFSHSNRYAIVKNGFATLADNVFIGDSFDFDEFVIPVIKASTGKWRKAIFPYDVNGKPLSKDTIFSVDKVALYLNNNKEKLLKGQSEEKQSEWYLYGRTQALKDVATEKISINNCVKDIDSIKLNTVPAGSGLYSGLYILTHCSFDLIKEIILSKDFIDYISTLKHYKSGGYYTFNSRELEQYINYTLTKHYKNEEYKSGILEGSIEFF